MRVQVEIFPWLSKRIAPGQEGPLVLEQQVEQGQILRDLLNELATRYDSFGQVVFDGENQQLQDHVVLLINGRLVRSPTELGAKLRDDDRVTIVPVYAGG